MMGPLDITHLDRIGKSSNPLDTTRPAHSVHPAESARVCDSHPLNVSSSQYSTIMLDRAMIRMAEVAEMAMIEMNQT